MSRRRRSAVCGLTGLVVALLAAGAPIGSAAAAPAAAARITLTRPVLPAGTVTQVHGTDFEPGTVRIRLYGQLLATTRVTSAGVFSVRLRLPASTAPGAHRVRAVEEKVSASAVVVERVDWPRPDFAVDGNAVNPYEHTITSATAPSLRLERVDEKVDGQVVIAGGVAYYVDDEAGYGNLIALDVATGDVVWEDGGILATGPVVVDVGAGLVLVNSGNVMLAYRTSDGSRAWYRTDLNATALAVDGKLFTTGASALVRLDPATGDTVWSADLGPVGQASGALPSYHDGRLFVTGSGGVGAYSADDGSLLWFSPAVGEGCLPDPPVVDGGQVITACNTDPQQSATNTLESLDESTGALQWTREVPGTGVTADPTVSNGLVISSQLNTGYAGYEEATGEPVWNFADGNTRSGVSPTVADGLVYGSDAAGSVFLLRVASGAVVYQFSYQRGFGQTPIVLDGKLYGLVGGGLAVFGPRAKTPTGPLERRPVAPVGGKRDPSSPSLGGGRSECSARRRRVDRCSFSGCCRRSSGLSAGVLIRA